MPERKDKEPVLPGAPRKYVSTERLILAHSKPRRWLVAKEAGLQAWVEEEFVTYGTAYHWLVEDPEKEYLLCWGHCRDEAKAQATAREQLAYHVKNLTQIVAKSLPA